MLKEDVKRKYSNEYAKTRERITEKVIYPPVPGMGQVLNTGIYQSNECEESDKIPLSLKDKIKYNKEKYTVVRNVGKCVTIYLIL